MSVPTLMAVAIWLIWTMLPENPIGSLTSYRVLNRAIYIDVYGQSDRSVHLWFEQVSGTETRVLCERVPDANDQFSCIPVGIFPNDYELCSIYLDQGYDFCDVVTMNRAVLLTPDVQELLLSFVANPCAFVKRGNLFPMAESEASLPGVSARSYQLREISQLREIKDDLNCDGQSSGGVVLIVALTEGMLVTFREPR